MTTPTGESVLVPRAKFYSRGIAWFTTAAGCLILVGWFANIPLFKSLFPHQVEAKVNTAICLVLLGLALSLHIHGGAQTGRIRLWVSSIVSGLASLIGLLTLTEYVIGRELGIDQWLLREPSTAISTVDPGRMAIPTALTFLFLGTAVITLNFRLPRFTERLLLFPLVVCGLAFLGYIFDFPALASFGPFTPIAAPIGLISVVFCVGVFLSAGGDLMEYLKPRALGFGFVVALLILITLGLSVARTAAITAENSQMVASKTADMDALDTIHFEVLDMVVRIRQNVFPGNEGSQVDFHNSEFRIRSALRKLTTPRASDSDRALKIAEFEQLTNQLIGFLKLQLDRDAERHATISSIQQAIDGSTGHRLLEDFRRKVSDLNAVNSVELLARQKGIGVDTMRAMTAFSLGLLVSFVLLIGIYSELRREIEGHTRTEQALVKTKEVAEKASAAKSEFLSRMSHELRTTLNAVIGFGQLLEMQSLDPASKESVKMVLQGGRHLLALVNEVLDMARIESGKASVSLEPVELERAIGQAIDLIRPIAEERGIELVKGLNRDQGYVMADRVRLAQILLNLLTNACKYNRLQGRVEIRCSHADPDFCDIEVSDTGMGFDERMLARMFLPFERGSNHSESGSGLGLSVSHGLAELMGGELTLVSSSEKGTVFNLKLRRANVPHCEVELTDQTSKPNAPAHKTQFEVLYVEDNPSNIQLMKKIAEMTGCFDLVTATLGGTGIKIARERQPDLVLLDMNLPDMDGCSVLLALKTDPHLAHIPVVILSADASEARKSHLISEGAMAYLTKPLDIQTLLATIDSIRSGNS